MQASPINNKNMLYEKDIRNLKMAHYHLQVQDKDNLISFLNGYFFAKKDKNFQKYISTYLHNQFQINIEYNTFFEQIDHYSFFHERSFFDGFFHLLPRLLKEKVNDKIKVNRKRRDKLEIKEKGKPLPYVKLNNGVSVSVGDLVQLNDIIKKDYEKSKFFDSSLRNPSWDLLYPSNDDFKYIQFYLENEKNQQASTFGRVRRIFSNTTTKIKEITRIDNSIILYTDLFRIEITNEIEKHEFKILSNNKWNQPNQLFDLTEKVSYFLNGISEYNNVEDLINHWCFENINIFNQDWLKFNRNMNGRWYKIKSTNSGIIT